MAEVPTCRQKVLANCREAATHDRRLVAESSRRQVQTRRRKPVLQGLATAKLSSTRRPAAQGREPHFEVVPESCLPDRLRQARPPG